MKHYLVAREDQPGAGKAFRVILAKTLATEECCWLNDAPLDALQLEPGEPVRVVPLY